MFATLLRAAHRKGIAAGLAGVVAVAGIGVAVAAPSSAPEEAEVRSTFAVGSTGGIDEVVGDTLSRARPKVDTQVTPTDEDEVVVEEDEVVEETSTPSPSVLAGVGGSPTSSPVTTPVDVSRFLPEGDLFDSDLLEELLAGSAQGADVAEGAEELASEVIARIQECVGGVVGQFGTGDGFDGSGFGDGQSFATDIVDDVLPCVAGLVENALSCVGGLVDEILAAVMTMDFNEIAGMAGLIVDELVDCVGGDLAD